MGMEMLVSVILILGALLAGAITPGPSFVLVARIAMGASRRDGVAASIGMGIGGAVFAVLALMGLHAALSNVPLLYFMLKLLGGLYLIYIAVRIWRGAKHPLMMAGEQTGSQQSLIKSFLTGLITQLSNPKTAIVYGSIFVALLPASIPDAVYFILPPLVFLIEAGWYLIVTLTLSAASPRAAYLRSKSLLDRIASGAMAGLGVKLITNAGN